MTGTEETAFDASRLFGSTMLAHAVFPYLAVGGLGLGSPGSGSPDNGSQGNRPQKYTPLKVGPSDSGVGGDYYQAQRWRVWAAGLGGSSSLDGDRGAGNLNNNVGGVAAGLDYSSIRRLSSA